MLDEQIEAVFENGVFRPLEPVDLPEHQRVTLVLPAKKDAARNGVEAETELLDEDVGYRPLPLRESRTIRVRLKCIADFVPLPYPVESDDAEQE
jgi:predicted DNA-binding antitoxin AbrB/MazE fold protein